MGRPKSKGQYVPLAAQYFMDDAVMEAGPSAELVFIRCLSFLASVPSDGFVTERQMRTIVGRGLRGLNSSLSRLEAVGLLEPVDGGYVARSWLKWNRSTEDTDRIRAKDRERKKESSRQSPGASPTFDLRKGDVRPTHPRHIAAEVRHETENDTSEHPRENAGDGRNSGRNPSGIRTDSEDQYSTDQFSTEITTSDASGADALSAEVIRLSTLLAELVRRNGHKATVTQRWHQACDRLIRLDGYTPVQVEWVMRWATSNEFWLANIRSMPKFREKFSTLKAQALAENEKRKAATTTWGQRRQDETIALVEHYQRQEGEHAQIRDREAIG